MPLRQADVLRGAMELLDEVGLDELTTRRLADRLGVRVGALYWHYPSKAALLAALAEQIVGAGMAAPLVEQDWEGRLRELALRARAAILAHRDGARLVASVSPPRPAVAAYFGAVTDTLRTAGATREAASLGADVLTSFVSGFVQGEQAYQAGRRPREKRDATFRLGLDVIVDGIRVSLLEE